MNPTAESERQHRRITTADGHMVGYAEYGHPQGEPVFYFHGLPSSRLEPTMGLHPTAEEMGIRLIAPDRPGIGLSDLWPYTLADYPQSVAALADALGIGRFAVMGVSGGGKFVAACAHKIPQRLTTASMIGGTAPFNLPGVKQALTKSELWIYTVGSKMPWLFRLMLWKIDRDVRKDLMGVLEMFRDLCAMDKTALADPAVQRAFQRMVTEASRQGTRGAALDWQFETQPWGFDLGEIEVPVNIWHGEEDTMVRLAHGRILADAIPNARALFVPEGGHLLALTHRHEVFRSVLGR